VPILLPNLYSDEQATYERCIVKVRHTVLDATGEIHALDPLIFHWHAYHRSPKANSVVDLPRSQPDDVSTLRALRQTSAFEGIFRR